MHKGDYTLSGSGACRNLFCISGNRFILNDYRVWAFPHFNQASHTIFHGFLLQQEIATYKSLYLLKMKTGCKNGPFCNVIILVESGSQLAGERCMRMVRTDFSQTLCYTERNSRRRVSGIGQKRTYLYSIQPMLQSSIHNFVQRPLWVVSEH